MKLKLVILSLSLLIVTAVFTPCFAAVEWSVQNRLQMESSPVDVAVSLNDKWVFVLNDRGEILVFSSDGSLKEKIQVGRHIDQIKVGPRDNLLYLGSRKNKTVDIIELDFIQNINTAGSPYKGRSMPMWSSPFLSILNDRTARSLCRYSSRCSSNTRKT